MSLNATLLGQMITFAIFVFFTMKVVWPIMEKALEERKIKISLGLEAAEKGQKKLLEAENEIKEKLFEVKKQSVDIIAQATKVAINLVEEAKASAMLEKEKVISTGYREVEQAVLKAKRELRDTVSDLVVSGVEKILKREITENTYKDILFTISKSL